MSDHEQPTVEQLNDEADIAADYLEGFLDILDYEGDIEMGVRNGRAVVQIVADDDTDIKHLTGKNGEVVEALQRLTRLAVQEKTGERSHLLLDVDGYIKKQREGLRKLALDAIEDVRESGEPEDLDPMNSFERKIVHDVVRDEGLKSRSHGEEPHRYVTIYLKASSNAAAEEEDEVVDEIDDEASDTDTDTVDTVDLNVVDDVVADDADETDEDVVDDDIDDDSDDVDEVDEDDASDEDDLADADTDTDTEDDADTDSDEDEASEE